MNMCTCTGPQQNTELSEIRAIEMFVRALRKSVQCQQAEKDKNEKCCMQPN